MSWMHGQFGSWTERAALPDAPASRADDTAFSPASDQAVCALVEEYAQTLYRVAYSVTRNSAEAEDAVQETFLRVMKNKHKLPAIRDARVWLVRITWNVVLDRKRRRKVRPETDDVAELARSLASSDPGSEATMIAAQRYARVLRLIDRLPAREREALLLSALHELSTGAIAAVLGTTESAVRSRLFRARQTLGKLLEQDDQTHSASLPASEWPR